MRTPKPAEGKTARQTLRDYLVLVKPGIMFALLISCLTAMFVAAGGVPDGRIIAATLVGGAFASGSAAALNNLLERDRDALMRRTRRRPLPAHRLEPSHAALFAAVLAGASGIVLTAFVNVLAAVLALGGLVFYSFVYTLWLKPLTVQNIVIGGAAGCFPALVGWAAVTGSIGLGAVLIALIVFLWTPPHFWSLALLYREDYEEAGFPMLPVVRGEEVTRQQILVYSGVLILVSVLLYPIGLFGPVYLVLSLLLGAVFLGMAGSLFLRRKRATARNLFRYSNAYLVLLGLSMILDVILPVGLA